ncbi:MAG: NAD(P)-dependent alcohol dehydrogenase [Actinomycetota bacterium]|nr:NAD(P)-dependent alcohol dehydrogenase [Actinomycetota bacterium]
MKAIVRSEYGSPDVLEFREVAKPAPNDDDVLVRVCASSVNMADVDYLLGRPKIARLGTGPRKPRNSGLGLDVAGQVETVGANVTRFQPGDEVFGDLTEHGFGAFAEYACAAESAFALKPAGMTFEEAAAVPQAAIMALQGLRGKRPIRPGDKVLINGAGGNVGPFALQIAKSFGAEVTGVDGADKLDMLRSIGADHVIDYTEQDYTRTGQRYDRILDVAAYRSIFASKRALRPEGVYVMVPGSISQMFQAMFVGPLISIAGSHKMGMMMWKPFKAEDVGLLKQLLEAGKVAPVIDRTYPLSEVPEALRYQQEGHTQGKVIITV